ncbi:hypothetical protein PHYSODRAFT_338064 [Phytophthora sojae]|uniref:Cell 12A endoglucanase n=1 Tax=Phytophthora sojae (strain P6497) TaxID=1094619 RepID=G5A0G1_PHYSP|nr:hypothetical protein PHYSODRAFT_338064 [Phytophthora sojae]EGZ11350.1 hypothetical protein PHYSODRAFT_338064 [Phytophthora sojae]|eukprot:XP_009534095.1 hypothetical protein PHYSODRAFT_338064 [Phytophthora sojae]
MKFLLPATVAVAALASSASAQQFCGRDDNKVVGDYTVYNNLWAEENDPKGGQCTFNWTGDSWQVKSFANAALNTAYNYTYDGKIIANVAYDMFTSSTESGDIEYELMVWLAALGDAWPLTSSGQPIKTFTAGRKVKVFTYVAKQQATSFTADLKFFFDQHPTDNNLPTTQFLRKVEAGTEPFQGQNATMVVSSYSVQVK